MEKGVCKVTGQEFEISEDEKARYAGFDLPIPDLSFDERLRRKLAFVNEQHFFWRKSSRSEKRIYGVFPADTAFPVFSDDEWRAKDWSPTTYGTEFSPKRPFFEQLYDFFATVPRPAVVSGGVRAVDGAHNLFDSNRCFRVTDSIRVEDCLYSTMLQDCSKVLDSFLCRESTSLYECIDCYACRELRWSRHCQNCSNSSFLVNCTDCSDCLFCVGLSGKRFCLFNQQLSATDYAARLSEWNFEARPVIETATDRFSEFLATQPMPHLVTSDRRSGKELRGNYLTQCRNIVDSFECFHSSDLQGCCRVSNGENCLDAYDVFGRAKNCAQVVAVGNGAEEVRNSFECWNNVSFLTYCAYCEESRNLFGCIGVRGGENMIFNRQYSANDYRENLRLIREVLERKRVWGKFFPAAFSDFAYNHSAAGDYLPLNKFQVEMLNFRWSETEESFKPSQLLSGGVEGAERYSEMPLRLSEFTRELASSAIFLCEMSGQPFQIHPLEFELYNHFSVAPPARAFLQRLRERMGVMAGRKYVTHRATDEYGEFRSPFPNDYRQPIWPRDLWLATCKTDEALE